MADTQNWTDFSGGCIVPGGGGHSNCSQGFVFNTFTMGLNDTSPLGLPLVLPTGDVVCTSRDNNANCYGYFIQLLQAQLCKCDASTTCVFATPTTAVPGAGGIDTATLKATIGTLVGTPIFGMGVLTEYSPDVDHVTGIGGIIDAVNNTLLLVQWNDETLNGLPTILATTPYVLTVTDKLIVTYYPATKQISVQVTTAGDEPITSIGTTTFTIAIGDFVGILVVGSSSGNTSDTVDLSDVDTDFQRLCV
jgi:hypothetical protein